MAHKKAHPGLDAVLTDDAIDRFAEANELRLVVPPERRLWPIVFLTGAISVTAGVGLAVVASRYVAFLQVALVVCSMLTAVAAVTYLECRRDDDHG